mmetsp:Transcript_6035/g.8539  ORF Transcript_6035/g.8539 Transcript_6035/m.8539 type:complete len:158 (+) Transcript_6035:34-507(+)
METQGSDKKRLWVAIAFRSFHIGLAAFMCVAAVDALENESDFDHTDIIFVAAYVFLFAVILAVFEISQFFNPFPPLHALYRQNFGFIFKPISKGVFIIFIGFLQFGLKNTFGLACGIISIADGVFLQLVYCKDSSLLVDGPVPYDPPRVPTARQQEV